MCSNLWLTLSCRGNLYTRQTCPPDSRFRSRTSFFTCFSSYEDFMKWLIIVGNFWKKHDLCRVLQKGREGREWDIIDIKFVNSIDLSRAHWVFLMRICVKKLCYMRLINIHHSEGCSWTFNLSILTEHSHFEIYGLPGVISRFSGNFYLLSFRTVWTDDKLINIMVRNNLHS